MKLQILNTFTMWPFLYVLILTHAVRGEEIDVSGSGPAGNLGIPLGGGNTVSARYQQIYGASSFGAINHGGRLDLWGDVRFCGHHDRGFGRGQPTNRPFD